MTNLLNRGTDKGGYRRRMDIQLNYIEKGSGAPLILLHGNGGNYGYFEHQIEYFAKKYRVIAIDTRGHGESPRGDKPFTIRQFAVDLKNFMDEKGIASANILGFSDGGNIALVFALKYPKCVRKLILNAANLYPSGVKARVMIPIYLRYSKALVAAGKSEQAKRYAEMQSLLVNEPDIKVQELFDLKVRTLVIAGTKDLIRKSHTRLIARSLPDSKLVFVKGGHGIAQENPDAFNEEVELFLRG